MLHPLFWAGLGVLAVNDHILKQTRVLPAALTGKLSDFAGLLVFLVVLGALLGVRGRIGRMALFTSVAGMFTAVKLSRPLADALEAVSAYTLLPWRLWCDPTDLMALSVLPLAWWLAAREGGPAVLAYRRLTPWLRAAGLVLGTFACAATSAQTEAYRGTAFLFNGTTRVERLHVYRLQNPLDCTRVLDAPSVWPGAGAFVLQSCPTLGPRDILPLDRGWKSLGEFGESGDFHIAHHDAGAIGPMCDAVLLRADGLRPVVVTWSGVSAIEFSGAERFGDNAADDHGLILERAGDRLFIMGTALLRVLPAGFEPEPAECPNGER